MNPDSPNYDWATMDRLLRMREMDEYGRGFICPKPLDDGIRAPVEIQELADASPAKHLLNYPESAVVRAAHLMTRVEVPGVEPPPAGYSQHSHLSQEVAVSNGMMAQSPMDSPMGSPDSFDAAVEDILEGDINFSAFHHHEPSVDSYKARDQLKMEWNQATNAIDNCKKKDDLIEVLRQMLDAVTVSARTNEGLAADLVGRMVSMLPENEKDYRTHGTKPYEC